MDAIYEFIDSILGTRFEQLPGLAVEAAKREVLDSLATALGGTTRPGAAELVSLVKEWGGSPQSTVIDMSIRCPAPEAALVNGTMIHALDYDDGHPVAQVHIGCVAVPTCFAVAERQGGITGKEMITALALGADFLSRLGLASRPHSSLVKSGWHPTPLYGYLGSAAMAGRIIRLNREKMLNALGIAYHQCAGSSQAVVDAAMTKRLGPGLAARGGITAALMAERGLTGAHNILEGQYGVFNQYHGGDYSREILTADLGRRFEGANIGHKPYPNCGFTHAFIDAVLSLRSKYNIQPAEVEQIIASGGDSAIELSTPLEVKQNPRNPVDSQFSLPWAIGVALVKGKVSFDDFTPAAIQDPAVLAVSRKVVGKLESSMSRHGVGPGRVTIEMKDGRTFTEHVEHCLGSVERPMSFHDIAAKFRQCAAMASSPLSNDRIAEVIGACERLEESDDATRIVKLVA